MKMRIVCLAIALGLITITVKGQIINLNDLIQCHKKGIQELSTFLKNKSRSWTFKGHDDDRNWWEYDNGSSTSMLYKLDGGVDETEIILITDNTKIAKTIFNDVKNNNMKSIDDKTMYLGPNYFVYFKYETNNKDETVWKISLSTRTAYLNWKERFNK